MTTPNTENEMTNDQPLDPRGTREEHADTGFWDEKVKWSVTGFAENGHRVARIDGGHFLIGPEPRPGDEVQWLGFRGRRFVIRFDTGEVVVTHNLWSQGEIPAEYRDRLGDNAVAVDGGTRDEYRFFDDEVPTVPATTAGPELSI